MQRNARNYQQLLEITRILWLLSAPDAAEARQGRGGRAEIRRGRGGDAAGTRRGGHSACGPGARKSLRHTTCGLFKGAPRVHAREPGDVGVMERALSVPPALSATPCVYRSVR